MSTLDLRSRFSRMAMFILVMVALLVPGVATALEITNFGPEALRRATGAPVTEVRDFPAVPGAGKLIVVETDSPRAVLRFNGQDLPLPAPPKHGATPLVISVELAEANRLEVVLFGKPGSILTVQVTQEVQADGAAVVGPAGGTVTVAAGPFAGAEIRVPADALATAVVIRARAVPDPIDAETEYPALEVLPHGLQFKMPATAVLPVSHAESASIQYASPGAPAWLSLGGDQCESGSLCAPLSSFSFLRVFYARLCRWVVTPGEAGQPPVGDWKCKPAFLARSSDWAPYGSKYWPVILVHGIQPFQFAFEPLLFAPFQPVGGFCGQASKDAWKAFPHYLREEGVDVWRFDYDHENGISVAALVLGLAVGVVQESTDTEQTTIVGHSMGGLVARDYFARWSGAARTSRLVTIGTPHLGSHWGIAAAALPGCRVAGSQLLPWSGFLDDLNAAGVQPLLGPRPQYVFIAGRDRRKGEGEACFAHDDDGIVTLDSALGLRPGNPSGDLYPDQASRVTQLGYAHTTTPVAPYGWLAPDSCGDKGMVEPDLGDPDHRVVHEVLKWVKIGPSKFEVLLLGGPSHGVVLDDQGAEKRRLPIPQLLGVYPAVLSDDGSRLAYLTGTGGGAGWLRVYEMATGEWHDVIHRAWLQTLKWLPGSNSEVVFWDDVTRSMRVIDVDSGAQRPWQPGWVDSRHYRGGIDWDDAAQNVVFEAGYPSAGGDGVYQATMCNAGDIAAANHLCDIQPIDVPGGSSASWATIAARPYITPEGREAYYFVRSNWTDAEVRRFDLQTRVRTSLRQWQDPDGSVLGLFEGKTLFLGAVSQRAPGQRALWFCPLENFQCSEMRTAPGTDFNVLVVAPSFPTP